MILKFVKFCPTYVRRGIYAFRVPRLKTQSQTSCILLSSPGIHFYNIFTCKIITFDPKIDLQRHIQVNGKLLNIAITMEANVFDPNKLCKFLNYTHNPLYCVLEDRVDILRNEILMTSQHEESHDKIEVKLLNDLNTYRNQWGFDIETLHSKISLC